jgi:hypothetical protein
MHSAYLFTSVLALSIPPVHGEEPLAAVHAARSVLRHADSATVEVEFIVRASPDRELAGAPAIAREVRTTFSVAWERDRALAIRAREGMTGVTVIVRQDELIAYIPVTNRYVVDGNPGNVLQVMMSDGVADHEMFQASAPLMMLNALSGWPIVKARQADVGGGDIEVRRFEVEFGDEQQVVGSLWITRESPPVVLRAMLSVPPEEIVEMPEHLPPGIRPPPEVPGTKYEWEMRFQGWRFSHAIPAETFELDLPATARRVETYGELY